MASLTPDISVILLKLPKEIHDAIYNYLESDDVKNLRVTCSAMAKLIPLSFDRVFISANSFNLKVFHAIADHNTLRHQVSEIVWDDARLRSGPELEEERENYQHNGDRAVTENGCPLWFKMGTHYHYQDREDFPSDYGFPDDLLSLDESWAYYKTLLEDQRQVIASNADIEAFKHGLRRFSSLKRVTVTPATHGRLRKPLYRTPMIRAFPRGFDYPLPEAWPCYKRSMPIDALPWMSQEGLPYQQTYGRECTAEAYRAKWRGYRMVMRGLVEYGNHKVTELKIGGNEIRSGLNCRIFDQRCVEYDDLVALLKRPGFRYLSLDLFTGLLEHWDWDSYKSGLLHDALAKAKDIQHISIRSTTDTAEGYPQQLQPDEIEENLVPLRTIFPIDHWPNLRHFGISHMLVQLDDLIDLLAALPQSLRSVELSHLAWGDEDHGYDDLIRQMRNALDWRSRPTEERPTVHLVASASGNVGQGRFVEVDEAVSSFLYGEGSNPFEDNPQTIYPGYGGVMRDMFDLKFKTPF
ncbi:hypothetical protein FOQG_15596 [Fusarium oxysporum f. sp. raphani 54005]|uniref:F-box domain-containing protein n=2 Tax=Fusarium oxysporum TaxID=5507 RepID=X0BMZ8_FUSOX|nr:hypothetical protein FOQG_15596 [Fusarium oxysporum f. sp. raphani 54005]RKK65313.1 hypothetical protein BFJ69_g16394 [Fusarium oxysporum]